MIGEVWDQIGVDLVSIRCYLTRANWQMPFVGEGNSDVSSAMSRPSGLMVGGFNMKTLKNSVSCVVMIWISTLCQSSAHAAITFYTSESSFTSGLQSGFYVENFNAMPDEGQSAYSGGTPTISYTFSAPGGISPADVAGTRDMSTFDFNDILVVTFGETKPTAIGGNFFLTDFNSYEAGTVRVQYGGTTEFYDVTSSSVANSFFGITTDNPAGFSSISFIPPISGELAATVDNFHVGFVTPVPEPGGWVAAGFVGLLVLGRAGRGFLRRRSAAST